MGEELKRRLGRLRRERAPTDAVPERSAGPASPGGAGPGLPIWLRRRLEASGRRQTRSASASRPRTVGTPRDLHEERAGGGTFLARVERFPEAATHGAWCPAEVDSVEVDALVTLTGDAALADFRPRRAVYLDTETTGLSGGAGTHVFQVGLGTFEAGAFVVWQGFLRGPEEEPALLAAAAERIRDADAVVSFFGKSFDRHRMEDKMRMHGVEPPFEGRPHLDLYHPCRRLYGACFEDARLATMERELTGVRREDDLPGSFAPEAWFDFLAGRPHLLEDVFRHNSDDVRSLAGLCAHLGRTLVESRADGRPLDVEDGAHLAAERARSLGRLLLARRRRAEALPWLERALDRPGLDGAARRAVRFDRAEALRFTGCREEACTAFIEVAGAERDPLAARARFEASRLESDPVLARSLLEGARSIAAAHAGTRAMELLSERIEAALARRGGA